MPMPGGNARGGGTPCEASSRAAGANWSVLVPVGLSIALLATNMVVSYCVMDDAYISFRYLDHLLRGSGLVFNPGERVEGYTNFLWIMALAPLRLLGLPPEAASLAVSLGCLFLVLQATRTSTALLTGDGRAGWAGVVLLACSVSLAFWATTGMESVLLTALAAQATARLLSRGEPDALSSLLFGLAVLTRPDAALLYAAVPLPYLALAAGVPVRRKLAVLGRSALFFLCLPLAHLLFRWAYYHEVVPNTFFAKLGVPAALLLPSGGWFLTSFLTAGGLVFAVLLATFFLSGAVRNWVALVLLLQILLQLPYVLRVGGDIFPLHRFLLPILPAMTILSVAGVAAVLRRWAPRLREHLPSVALALGALTAVLAYSSEHWEGVRALQEQDRDRSMIAAWIAENLPKNSRLAVNAAGLIPYRTGLETIDMLGLTDRHIARVAVEEADGGRRKLAHFKSDGAYVYGLAPDVILPGGALLSKGENSAEATVNSALEQFASDQQLVRVPGFNDRYAVATVGLAPGKYLVMYRRRDSRQEAASSTGSEDPFERGLTLMGLGRYEAAIEAFREALVRNPERPAAWTNIGFCLSDGNRHREAMDFFQKALILDSRYHQAIFGLAQAYDRLDEPARALEQWRRYLEIAPESQWKELARRRVAAAGD